MHIPRCLLPLLLLALQAPAQSSKTIDRDVFSVSYPAGWYIDTTDEDYDPDALFSLDAPDEESYVMFMVFNQPMDAGEMLDAQQEALVENLVRNPDSITTFTRWGKLEGMGRCIRGKFMGVFKGEIRIFFYTDADKSLLVLEQFYDKSRVKWADAFKGIADSFRFK